MKDTELGGKHLPAGTEVLLALSGAHPEPRLPTAYRLAFGYGPHQCLGARLAELESTVVIETLARALPGLRPAGHQPQWMELLSFRTPLTVEVER